MNDKDFLGGLLLIVVGGIALWTASDYPMGSISRMGPGYLPVALGWLLVGFGLVICVSGLRRVVAQLHATKPVVPDPDAGVEGVEAEAADSLPLRPLFVLTLAVVSFGMLLERAGLVVASMAAVAIACAAHGRFRPVETLVLAACLTFGVYMLFVVGLGMPFTIWSSL